MSAKVVQLMVYAFIEVISHYFNLHVVFLRIVFNYCICVEKLHYPGCCEVDSIHQSHGEQIALKDLCRECLLSCIMNYVNQFI